MLLKQFLAAACGNCLALLCVGQISVVSNRVDSPGDFVQIDDAMAAGAQTIEVVGGLEPYEEIVVDRAIRIVGRDGEATLSRVHVIAGGELWLEQVIVPELIVEGGRMVIAASILGELTIAGLSDVEIQGSIIEAGPGEIISFTGGARVELIGNLIVADSEGALLSDWRSWTSLRHNTLVDSAGRSEWVIYRGEVINNIVTFGDERFARFDVFVSGNGSTRSTFAQTETGNVQNIAQSALFHEGVQGYERFEPLAGSPARGIGVDGTTAGFSGGTRPMDWSRLPGSFSNPHGRLRTLFGEELNTVGPWVLSRWFGTVMDQSNEWVFHSHHHFIYPVGNPDSFYFYDHWINRWFWTNGDIYPYLFMFGESASWIIHARNTVAPSRLFYDPESGQPVPEGQLIPSP